MKKTFYLPWTLLGNKVFESLEETKLADGDLLI